MFRRSLPVLLIPAPFRHIATGLWVTLTCAVTVLSLMPHVGPPGEFHIDKVVHLIAYGALAGLPFTAFQTPRIAFGAALAMAPLGLSIEFAQDFVPSRQADTLDMLANLAGVAIGIGLGPIIRMLANRILPGAAANPD
jgi:VanZ family protein